MKRSPLLQRSQAGSSQMWHRGRQRRNICPRTRSSPHRACARVLLPAQGNGSAWEVSKSRAALLHTPAGQGPARGQAGGRCSSPWPQAWEERARPAQGTVPSVVMVEAASRALPLRLLITLSTVWWCFRKQGLMTRRYSICEPFQETGAMHQSRNRHCGQRAHSRPCWKPLARQP